MAFKILTIEEIDLLDEKQKEIYLEEYDLYKERCRFVEKLEQYGRIEKKCHSSKRVKLKRITPTEVTFKKSDSQKIHFDQGKIKRKIKSDEELFRLSNLKINENTIPIEPGKVNIPNSKITARTKLDKQVAKLGDVKVNQEAAFFADHYKFNSEPFNCKTEKVEFVVPDVEYTAEDAYQISKIDINKMLTPDINYKGSEKFEISELEKLEIEAPVISNIKIDEKDTYIVAGIGRPEIKMPDVMDVAFEDNEIYQVSSMEHVEIKAPVISDFKVSAMEVKTNAVNIIQPDPVPVIQKENYICRVKNLCIPKAEIAAFDGTDTPKVEAMHINVNCPKIEVAIPEIEKIENKKVDIKSPDIRVKMLPMDKISNMQMNIKCPDVATMKIEKVPIKKVNVTTIQPNKIDMESVLSLFTR